MAPLLPDGSLYKTRKFTYMPFSNLMREVEGCIDTESLGDEHFDPLSSLSNWRLTAFLLIDQSWYFRRIAQRNTQRIEKSDEDVNEFEAQST